MNLIDKRVEINREGDVVRSVQINTTYSEDQGEFTSTFYYRLDTELGVGANNTEALAVITIEHKNPIDYDHFHQHVMRQDLANEGKCDVSLIVPITKEQYESEKYAESDDSWHA